MRKIYKEEELEELIRWFDNRPLPASLYIDKATYVPDVKVTVESLIGQSLINIGNPKMQGCITLLDKVKQRLEESETA